MNNKAVWILLAALTALAAVFLTGCATGKGEGAANDYEEGRSLELKRFSFSHGGMSMEQCYGYSAERTETGIRVSCEVFAGSEGYCTVDFPVEEAAMQAIERIAGEYGLDRWDGFDKTAQGVMDGSSFSLSMTLADGTEVYAHGGNKFPDSYRDAAPKLEALFAQLIYESGEVYPRTLDSDDLRRIDIHFGPKDESFSLRAEKREGGGADLSITVRGFKAYFPEGIFYFDGACEAFPFEELQSLVRAQKLPDWNGWRQYGDSADDGEWFTLSLDYESGESVFAEGRRYPEGYPEAREALLELLCPFVRDNREAFQPYSEG